MMHTSEPPTVDDLFDHHPNDPERGNSTASSTGIVIPSSTLQQQQHEDNDPSSFMELPTMKNYNTTTMYDGGILLPPTSASSLPTPEEHIMETGSFSMSRAPKNEGGRCRRLVWTVAVIGIIVLFVLIVGISLGVTQGSNQSKTSNQQKAAATRPDIADWITRAGISSLSAVSTMGTPQYQAIEFLVNVSSVLPTSTSLSTTTNPADLSGYLFAVKYVMAVTYYSTMGKNWLSSLRFVQPTEHDICNWFTVRPAISEYGELELSYTGLLCDEVTGLPLALDLGT